MKILHCADFHTRDKDIEESKKVLNYLVNYAAETLPDLIINAGDIFDSQNVKLDSPAAKLTFEILYQLAEIAPVLILIGTPSHDGKAIEIARLIKAQYPVYVSTMPEQLYFTEQKFLRIPPDRDLEIKIDAVISCIPTPTKQYFQGQGTIMETDQQIGDAMTAMFSGFASMASEFDAPHIGVGHFQIGGAFVSETQQLIGRDIEVSRQQIEAGNFDLVCLGHIHFAQQIGNNIFYSGSIYPKTYGETEDKGFYIHYLSKIEPGANNFVKVPHRKMVKFNFDFSGGADIANIGMGIGEIKDDFSGANIKVNVKIYEDEIGELDKELMLERFTTAGAKTVDLNIIRVPRENVRSEKLLSLTTLPDKIRERAKLTGDVVGDSVIKKAELLESQNQEQVIDGLKL